MLLRIKYVNVDKICYNKCKRYFVLQILSAFCKGYQSVCIKPFLYLFFIYYYIETYKITNKTHVIYFFLFKTQHFHNNLSFQFQWSPSQFNLSKEQIHSNQNIKVSLNWFNRKYPTWQQPLNKTLQDRHLTNGRAVWQLQKQITIQRIHYIMLSGCINPNQTAYSFCPPW